MLKPQNESDKLTRQQVKALKETDKPINRERNRIVEKLKKQHNDNFLPDSQVV